MKISELAQKTCMSYPKLRKVAGSLLGPDPIARQRSGRARKLSLDEAWRVYLAAYLIEHCFRSYDWEVLPFIDQHGDSGDLIEVKTANHIAIGIDIKAIREEFYSFFR
jgi:hypothetical protein